jgi:hypothetical protein
MKYVTKSPYPIAFVSREAEWVTAHIRRDGDWTKTLLRLVEGGLLFNARRVQAVAEGEYRKLNDGERERQVLKMSFASAAAAEEYLTRILKLGRFALVTEDANATSPAEQRVAAFGGGHANA